jgi:hypothetical protein
MGTGWIKPFAWGVGVGAIALLIVIFSTGWAVTSGAAKKKSEEMVQKAILDRLAPICVEQFLRDPGKEKKLKELKDTDSWRRGEYVEKQGWATMPGEKEPDRRVAVECARLILEIQQ